MKTVRGNPLNLCLIKVLEYCNSQVVLLISPILIAMIFFIFEQVIDSVASECIILVDQPKVVHRLGSSFPVPVS